MSLMANDFLYHGSNQVIEHPICDMGAKGRDFGVCFYTTYSKKQLRIGPIKTLKKNQWLIVIPSIWNNCRREI